MQARARLEEKLRAADQERVRIEREAAETLATAKKEAQEQVALQVALVTELQEKLRTQTEAKDEANRRPSRRRWLALRLKAAPGPRSRRDSTSSRGSRPRSNAGRTEAEAAEALAAAKADSQEKAQSYAAQYASCKSN